jgi:hypothetical protein
MKKISLALVLCLCISLCGCIGIGRPADVMGKLKLCDTCKECIVGTWYWIDQEGTLMTCEYREDGTIVGLVDTRWNCACENGNHAIRIGGDNYTVGLTNYDPETGLENWEKDEGYTFVEVTQENWRTYFSEDFFEVFEVRYMLHPIEETDEWGETTVRYGLVSYAALKDNEKYGPLTTLKLEVDLAYSDERILLDPEKAEFLGAEIMEMGDMERTTIDTAEDPKVGVFFMLDSYMLDELEPEVELSLTQPGDTIYRMKGILVIK